MTESPNLQDLILDLERFWASKGCLIWQPYSEKLGAGTMNPATFLRVIGPEPWSVAYVEPSFRPDDGRFSENPNRMQMFLQYQVILKPDPGNPMELYLKSLEAVGIDTSRHDIRFVEDNWESPVLGAWGLGWEVWLDGMEITQFTYFQQAGGMALDPVAVEITYGLERTAMYLQGVRDVWELRWNNRVTYGEMLKQQEIEYCNYAFNTANVERLQSMYSLFAEEAREALDRGQILPAYDYVVRCSHAFNLLDTRGAVGVTERARFFGEMRELARLAAEMFGEQRKEKQFPLLGKKPDAAKAKSRSEELPDLDAADLLLEIGSEELPATDVRSGTDQLRTLLAQRLDEERLAYEKIQIGGTPRRLSALVTSLAGRQPDEERWVRGPTVNVAYDESGAPTRALEGFCRGQGVRPEGVEKRKDEKGVECVYALRKGEGRRTQEILSTLLPELIGNLKFGKTMRWDSDGVSYPRPIRWLVALFGSQVIPITYARADAGRASFGLRSEGAPAIEFRSADEYQSVTEKQGILVDRDLRRRKIQEQVRRLAEEVGGVVAENPDLLEEVTDLVEAPFGLRGSFDASHLELPQEVLTTVMSKHQRYFPILDLKTSRLLPHFITIANGRSIDPETVLRGNEGVIRARYADAAFFYREDSRRPLEEYLPSLDTLTFQENLGSVLDKTHRVEKLVPALSSDLGLAGKEQEMALRAAKLCKADLATSMVIELTSLQGVMGRYYALASGEPEPVAEAIQDHYHPRFPGDVLPSSLPGFALSVADRLDSLAGLFSVGIKPRATADPYGLRRDALGLLANLIGHRCRFSLKKGLEAAADLLPIEKDLDRLQDALNFILRRLAVQLRDEGFKHDVIEATIKGGCDDPFELRQIVEGLTKMVESEDWLEALHAYSRCKRIVKDLPERLDLDPNADKEEATQNLAKAFHSAKERMDRAEDRIETLDQILTDLRNPINTFFDDVLVMSEDKTLRNTRLALVQGIAVLPDGIADLSLLEGF